MLEYENVHIKECMYGRTGNNTYVEYGSVQLSVFLDNLEFTISSHLDLE